MKVDVIIKEKKKLMTVEEIHDFLGCFGVFRVKKEVFYCSCDTSDDWLGFMSDGTIAGFSKDDDLVDYLRALKITKEDFIELNDRKISLTLKIE